MKHTNLLAGCVCGLAVLWSSIGSAQDTTASDQDGTDNSASQADQPTRPRRITRPVQENRYRIGIDCRPISEPLRFQLGLDDDTGLMVHGVMGDSPAGRAGVKRFDVITAADGQAVSSTQQLIQAVNKAGEQAMTLSLIRRGDRLEVQLTPEQRDEREIAALRKGVRQRLRRPAMPWFGGDEEEMWRQLEQFDGGPRGAGDWGMNGWRQMLPGIVFEPGDFPNPNGWMQAPSANAQALPHGFQFGLEVNRNGDGPAQIKVRKGDKQWEVSEDNLGELPEDLRPMVENMLNGGGRMNLQGLMMPQGGWGPWGHQPRLRANGPIQGRAAQQGRSQKRQLDAPEELEERFDGLQLQLKELHNAIRSLQEERPQQTDN